MGMVRAARGIITAATTSHFIWCPSSCYFIIGEAPVIPSPARSTERSDRRHPNDLGANLVALVGGTPGGSEEPGFGEDNDGGPTEEGMMGDVKVGS